MVVKADGLTLFREVKGSKGFGATSPYRQHFGLGSNAMVDSLELTWPSGLDLGDASPLRPVPAGRMVTFAGELG